jgi:hypothetical protein
MFLSQKPHENANYSSDDRDEDDKKEDIVIL